MFNSDLNSIYNEVRLNLSTDRVWVHVSGQMCQDCMGKFIYTFISEMR